ncbi:MAG: hypothetical protein DHS20C15_13000 [Planctomycetota bacterium]|nr:MAG: hypothetical protein DHS20C15_13000 [Planctomycetota bacterium]
MRIVSRCTVSLFTTWLRPLLRVAVSLAAWLGVTVAQAPPAQVDASPKAPNLLVILLDDWGIDRFDGFPTQPDTSARTPVLDAFAADNLLFTRAYADPVCSPSRAAALTGEYGRNTGVGTGFTWFNSHADSFALDLEACRMLPAELRTRGYRNIAIGKWHLTANLPGSEPYMHPIRAGFDVHDGVITNLVGVRGMSYVDYEVNLATAEGSTQHDVTDGLYLTTRQIDDALRHIEAAGEQPWFTWLALTAPHAPWHKPPQSLVSVDLDSIEHDDNQALYDAMLEAADTEIGRLLQSLDADTRANTVVFVMGDNGTPGTAFNKQSESGGKKGFPDEGGIHVPLIVSAPGLAAGTSAQLVHIVDLHATLLELAGADALDNDSVSFAPRLRGESGGAREWVYSARRRPNGFSDPPREFDRRSLRNDHWKLITQTGSNDQRKSELRFLGDALWGEGEPVSPSTDESRAARRELQALLKLIEER